MRLSGIEALLVAPMVTKEFATGVVVPKRDGVVAPTTAPAICANAADVICCRGDNVSELLLSDETSTCKYTEELLEKSRFSESGYPFVISPMFTVNTPCRTVAVVVAGTVLGHKRVPEPTVALFQIENLK